jgi:hypothetical protein
VLNTPQTRFTGDRGGIDMNEHEKRKKNEKTFRHRPKWQLSMAEQIEGVINCPRCLIEYNQEHPMLRLGDYPEEVFCPGCDIGILIKIRYDGNDDV